MTWGLQKSRDGQVWPRGARQAGRQGFRKHLATPKAAAQRGRGWAVWFPGEEKGGDRGTCLRAQGRQGCVSYRRTHVPRGLLGPQAAPGPAGPSAALRRCLPQALGLFALTPPRPALGLVPFHPLPRSKSEHVPALLGNPLWLPAAFPLSPDSSKGPHSQNAVGLHPWPWHPLSRPSSLLTLAHPACSLALASSGKPPDPFLPA